MKIKTSTRAAGLSTNHNQRLVAKTKIRAGGGPVQGSSWTRPRPAAG